MHSSDTAWAPRVLDSDKPHEHVTISEMLPTPDQAWLEDAAGQTYTSEFRIVVLDLLK